MPASPAKSRSALPACAQRHADREKSSAARRARRRTAARCRSSAFSISRRAISAGVRLALAAIARIAPCARRHGPQAPPRRRWRPGRRRARRAPACATGLARSSSAASSLSVDAEGADQPLLPAARQAECGHHRLENALVAERDRQRRRPAAAAREAHAHRRSRAHRRARCRSRPDPRCRPGRIRSRPRGAGGTPRRDRHSAAASRSRLDVARQTGMVNSGRRHRLAPVSLSVMKMRRRRSSPAMSRKGSAGWMTGASTRAVLASARISAMAEGGLAGRSGGSARRACPLWPAGHLPLKGGDRQRSLADTPVSAAMSALRWQACESRPQRP